MKSINDLKDIISESNISSLRVVETTSSANGYPSHVMPAITGFESWEQAEQFANANKLTLMWCDYRDGQNLWYRAHNAIEPMTITADDFGDSWSIEDNEEFWFEGFRQDMAECESIEQMQELIKVGEEIHDAFATLGDDEALLLYEGSLHRVIQAKNAICFYDEDVRHTELVAIDFL